VYNNVSLQQFVWEDRYFTGATRGYRNMVIIAETPDHINIEWLPLADVER